MRYYPTGLSLEVEFERALTQEGVRPGLRLARSKGKKLGRPRAGANLEQVTAMRTEGASRRVISELLGNTRELDSSSGGG